MTARYQQIEKNADERGKIAAGVAFILLVVLLLLPVFFKLNPPPGQPGIAVLLAFDDQGSGNDPAGPPPVTQPEPTPQPPQPEPEPATPPPPPPPAAEPVKKPVERDVIQAETPQEIAIRKQKEQQEAQRREAQRREAERQEQIRREQDAADRAERERVERERREAEARQAAIDEANRKAEEDRKRRQAAQDRFRNSVGGSLEGGTDGQGPGDKPGTTGSEDGIRQGGVTAGTGGRVSGGLGGRGLLSSPPVRDASQRSGTVIVDVCVDQNGNIVSAKKTLSGTTTTDSNLINAAVSNAKKWKFKADPTAPATQCGKITYNFRVQ